MQNLIRTLLCRRRAESRWGVAVNAQCDVRGRRGLRIFMAIVMLGMAGLVDIECANATTVKACKAASLARMDKARVDELAKNLAAPQLLDEEKSFYCRQGARAFAFFQTMPVRAADGAFETKLLTCRRDDRWMCDPHRERAIDMVDADAATFRITTRGDLSAETLRELYSTALKLAGSDSVIESPACQTPVDQGRILRAMFLRDRSTEVNVSGDGTLFDVERDHIEISFSIEENANGVKTTQYRCIVRWPAGPVG